MGARSVAPPKSCRQATLSQIEARLAPCVPSLLFQPSQDKDFSRQRIYTRARTFWGWIWQILQGNTSCREVVLQVQALFALVGARSVEQETGAYCLARAKLSLSWLEEVFAAGLRCCQGAASATRLLQGRPLRVIDGSGSRLADTPQNRQAYPPNNETSGAGFPFLRFTTLFCLGSGAIMARRTGGLDSSETQHLVSFQSLLHKGDILIGDRAYGLFVFLALLQSWGVDLLARVATRSRRVDYRQATKKFGPNDALFVWKKGDPSKLLSAEQWTALPEKITVRVLRCRVSRKGFRTKLLTVVTTLIDAQK